MDDTEKVRRYAMLGVTAYAEKVIREFFALNGKKPGYLTFGKLEWDDVMKSTEDEDFSVAGVVVLPALHIHSGIEAHA